MIEYAPAPSLNFLFSGDRNNLDLFRRLMAGALYRQAARLQSDLVHIFCPQSYGRGLVKAARLSGGSLHMVLEAGDDAIAYVLLVDGCYPAFGCDESNPLFKDG
jgi:hypothetical protein